MKRKEADDLEGWDAPPDTSVKKISSQEPSSAGMVMTENRKNVKKKIKSGGFQVMGLCQPLIKGILRKGYKVPTPIQRKVIPLILDGKDVVAMARTGSGKTAAFLIPLFERLKMHSAKVGARALILSPTRELALQTLIFAKELGKFMNLRAASVLGGESMEMQFAAIHENPDIIIATPGRFTHLCVEMKLRLESVEYVVFDEADRLFEMGFQEQLTAIVSRLSSGNRQTLLFSATLPKSLVEFARAGLTDPTLVRLDTESKIPENLKLAFFKVNSDEKFPLLLHLLQNVIDPSEMTLVFVPTKYHVEFLHEVLNSVGVSSSYVFSSLDPAARKINVAKFRAKKVSVLIVTDVAARGIDIPLLDNVINVDFPSKVKLFVHRVGRVARGTRKGMAYSLVSSDELCYLLELHMFLNASVKFAPLISQTQAEGGHLDRVLGRVPQDIMDENMDSLQKTIRHSHDLQSMKKSVENAYQKYFRSRVPPSAESVRRLKEELWGSEIGVHPIFKDTEESSIEAERIRLLEKLKNVQPKSTIFEIKKDKKGSSGATREELVMQQKRKVDAEKIANFHDKMKRRKLKVMEKREQQLQAEKERSSVEAPTEVDLETAFDAQIGSGKRKGKKNTMETGPPKNSPSTFIPYAPTDYVQERGYSVFSNFEKESAKVSLDLMQDNQETKKRNKPQVKWDKKSGKFKTQEAPKRIKTESGAWVSASYKTDLYQKWKMKMHPESKDEEEEEEEEEDQGWESGRGKGKRKNTFSKEDYNTTGFVNLTASKGSRYKPHPLINEIQQQRITERKRGPKQVRSYDQMVKHESQKKKIRNFQTERRKQNEMRRAKTVSKKKQQQRKKRK